MLLGSCNGGPKGPALFFEAESERCGTPASRFPQVDSDAGDGQGPVFVGTLSHLRGLANTGPLSVSSTIRSEWGG